MGLGAYAGDVGGQHFIHKWRIPVQAWQQNLVLDLTKTQHHAAFLLVKGIDAGESPDGHHRSDCQAKDTLAEDWAATAAAASATALATKHFAQVVL